MSLHDPISRKRPLEELSTRNNTVNKKMKEVDTSGATMANKEVIKDESGTGFSEKVYKGYVLQALESLDKVCILLAIIQFLQNFTSNRLGMRYRRWE